MAGVLTALRAGRDRWQGWHWALDRRRLQRRLTRAADSGAPQVLDVTLRRRGIGMFAELNWVLYLLTYAHHLGMRPRIRLASGTYFDPSTGDEDWLAHLFDVSWRVPPHSGEQVVSVDLTHLAQLPDYDARVGRMTLADAHALAAQYLQPTPAIREVVTRFTRDHLGTDYVALHWRGTDKVLEAPPVSREEVRRWIVRVVHALGRRPSALFVASDDRRLIADVRTCAADVLRGVPVVSRHEEARSPDGRPLHLRTEPDGAARRTMGEDALIDCLLLSGGVALIRTASFLSGWCSIFAPTLPVYLMNAPNSSALWFPDREVVAWAATCAARLEAQ